MTHNDCIDNERMAHFMLQQERDINAKVKEALDKERAYMSQAQTIGSGMVGRDYDNEPRRAPWRERVYDSYRRAEREGRKAERLAELVKLLDANPDVARILELVNDLEIYS